MTVNERLFHKGLIDDFDRARLRKDRVRLVEIMREIDLPNYDVSELF